MAIRVLFVFDPWSQAVLLVAGNKAGNWSRWYQQNIPVAEVAYEAWLDNERERRGES
ncbi:type II toxin-antitoxin system RelE/ParE family toxin [Micromonospora sp. A3M-1-15]|uniref:type II toxin-antitoxin system RelE/ParE family toxin n=1 Tax=Micromonospora sp. A3M-1-15 TaxID=2962035 RepID=UPI0020B8973E|nr:type II toxin-antitoxin system RelE/ParE family toxin [Micromonospora sp. A3M-1-15]